MNLYHSDFFSIDSSEKDQLLLPRWSGKELTTPEFMEEMSKCVEVVKDSKAKCALWDNTQFNFQIPDTLFPWIEETINIPGKKMGMENVCFIIGEDVMAQISTMDCFETTNSVYTPKYFADPDKAFDWVGKNKETLSNSIADEIDLVIKKNIDKGTAQVQLEVSLDQLPHYLKSLNEMISQQTFANENYQKYSLLTEREKEILHQLAKGYSNKEISESFYISLHTMTTHRRNIIKKLGCKNIAELMRYKVFLYY